MQQIIKINRRQVRTYRVPLQEIKKNSISLLIVDKDVFIWGRQRKKLENLGILYDDIFINPSKLEKCLKNHSVDTADFSIKEIRTPRSEDLVSEKMEAIIGKLCPHCLIPLYGKSQARVMEAITFLAKGKINSWNETIEEVGHYQIDLSGLHFYRVNISPFFINKVYPLMTFFASIIMGLFAPKGKELSSAETLLATGFGFWLLVSFLQETRWYNPWISANLRNTITDNTRFPNGWTPLQTVK